MGRNPTSGIACFRAEHLRRIVLNALLLRRRRCGSLVGCDDCICVHHAHRSALAARYVNRRRGAIL